MKIIERILMLSLVVILLVSVTGCIASEQNTGAVEVPSTNSASDVENENTTEMVFVSENTIASEQVEESVEAPETSATIPTETISKSETAEELDQTQKNSVAMLNFLSLIAQEVNYSENGSLYLDIAYSMLVSDIKPEMVDELTQEQINNLLDAITKNKLIGLKHDRLNILFERTKARTIWAEATKSIQNSGGIHAGNLVGICAEAGNAVVDYIGNHMQSTTETDYLLTDCELSDEAIVEFHECRKDIFNYRVHIIRKNHLPSAMSLNDTEIEDFVQWEHEDNVAKKTHIFEQSMKTYQYFGPYWLELTKCYYENGEYQKCLEALAEYKNMGIDIFSKDYFYARALPSAVIAASHILDDAQYIRYAEDALIELQKNIELTDWDLHYFAAETYIDLYSRTGNSNYLQAAFEIALNNVNILAEEQIKLNKMYLKDVEVFFATGSETPEVEDLREKYNKELIEGRKKELPPIYEPLAINCELLFSLAKELNVAQSVKDDIEQFLTDSGEGVFMNEYLRQKYSFVYQMPDCIAEFKKNELVIPARFLSNNSGVRVNVVDNGTVNTYDDWTIQSVERKTDKFNDFTVTLESEEIDNQAWSENAKVTVIIYDKDAAVIASMAFVVEDYTEYWIFGTSIDFKQVG
ncbi:MAG: hypothetical protein VZQ29_00795 [Succiniclasticum sp.]|nr:hypothetical protein [Succiniclasticum sp.]